MPVTFLRRRVVPRLTRIVFGAAPLLLACLSGLTELLTHDFAFVANAFALVGLRRTQIANLGGDLTDALLVDAVDVNFVRALDRERDARRAARNDRVRVAEREVQVSPAF